MSAFGGSYGSDYGGRWSWTVTVVMEDSTSRSEQSTKDASPSVILYADDALLGGQCQHRLQHLLGAMVGIELH
eukprot:9326366-Pyramimonas_sp.AAC.1